MDWRAVGLAAAFGFGTSVSAEVLDVRLQTPAKTSWFSLSASMTSLDRPAAALYVLTDGQRSVPAQRSAFESAGGVVRGTLRSLPAWIIEIPRENVAALATLDGVQRVEPALPPWQTTNDQGRSVIGVDPLVDSPWFLDGTGVELGMIEIGQPDGGHEDLIGRVNGFCGVDGHATHVAGTLIGDGSLSDGQYRGIAPQAVLQSRCISFNGSDPIFYADPSTLEMAYDTMSLTGMPVAINQSMGINVSSNGYDCALMGDYGITSALLDEMVRGSLGQPIVSIWSAGNERGYDTCPQEYGTVSPPAGAKNIVTVGAVYSDTLTPTTFTSFGPTDDGRVKPDVVAAGGQLSVDGGITSCRSGGGYEVRSGTSMAAPAVTGIVGLMDQAWQQVAANGANRPTPSTIRGILCHTATDVDSPGPDYRTGWGLINAEDAIETILFDRWMEAELGASGVFTYGFELSATAADSPLKISLAWDDPASIPGQTIGLVHDLDLLLRSPDGTIHRPWTLNPEQPQDAATRTIADDRNVYEQVLVDQPLPGLWEVIVSSSGELQGSQRLSLIGLSDGTASQTFLSFGDLPEVYPVASPLGISVTVQTFNEEVIPGSTRLWHRVGDSSFTASSLQQLAGPGQFAGLLPAAACNETVDFYVEVETTQTGTHFLPSLGPAAPASLTAAVSPAVTFFEDFTDDSGWTIEANAAIGNWQISTSELCWNQIGEVPALHTDGAGFCDKFADGTTRATSPPIVIGGPEPILAYDRFWQSFCQDPMLVEFSVDQQEWFALEQVEGDDSSPEIVGVTFNLGQQPGFTNTGQLWVRFTLTSDGTFPCSDAYIMNLSVTDLPCGPISGCVGDLVDAFGHAGPDGIVGVTDVLVVIMNFGLGGPTGDLDGDGDVDITDLLRIIGVFGPCPEGRHSR